MSLPVARAVGLTAVWLTAAFVPALSGGPLAAQPSTTRDDVPEVVRELIEEGDHHLEAGRIDQALASYREARRLGPEVTRAYVSLGALHVARGELEAALETYAAGLETAPDDRQLRYNAAVVALRLELHHEALDHVERGLEHHRGDAELHSLHGAVLSRLGRPDEALPALETAVRHQPGDPQILFRLGNLYHQLGRDEQAIDAYSKAVQKDRTLLRAYYNLGAVLVEMGRYDEASEAYGKALEPLEKAFAAGEAVDPVHARAYQNLGAIHFHRQEWQRALDAYAKALRLDPSLPVALYNQGFIHFRLGRFDDAEAAYSRALELDPELPLAYLHLGQIHRREGRLEEAVRRLTEGLPRFDDAARLEALASLAACHAALGHLGEAEAAWREVLDANPSDLPARLALGRLMRRAGRTSEARVELELARRTAPDDLGAALELATLARLEGRADEEQALYEEILERAGTRPETWPVRLSLALLHLRRGSVVEARRHLDTLTRMKPSTARRPAPGPGPGERHLIEALGGLALALDGDVTGARKRLRAVLAEDPELAAAADVAAVVDALASHDGALTSLERAYARHEGGAFETLAHANFGQALWLAGRAAEARPHLQAAAETRPDWWTVQAILGDVALAEKRYRDAIDRLERAAELCGDSPTPPVSLGPPPGDHVFWTTIGGATGGSAAAGGELCERTKKSLALARLGAALEALAPALRSGGLAAVRELADAALEAGLDPAPRAAALFVRGTARLALGNGDEVARRDLAAALQLGLAEPLQALAYNNLGIASTRLGRVTEARSAFESARAAKRPFTGAVLNLGILLDDHAGEPNEALERYREYLAAGGAKRREVASWIARLEKIYR